MSDLGRLRVLHAAKDLAPFLISIAHRTRTTIRILEPDARPVFLASDEGTELGCRNVDLRGHIERMWGSRTANGANALDGVAQCVSSHDMSLWSIRDRETTVGILSVCPFAEIDRGLFKTLADLLGGYVSLAREGVRLWHDRFAATAAFGELHELASRSTSGKTFYQSAMNVLRECFRADLALIFSRRVGSKDWPAPVLSCGDQSWSAWGADIANRLILLHEENRCPACVTEDVPSPVPLEVSSMISAALTANKAVEGRIALCTRDGSALSGDDLPLLDFFANAIEFLALQNREHFVAAAFHQLDSSAHRIINLVSRICAQIEKGEPPIPRDVDLLRSQGLSFTEMIKRSIRYVELRRSPPELRPASLKDLLEWAVVELKAVAESKGVVLSVEVPAGQSQALIDNGLMQVALRNLVENAIGFSKPGGLVKIELENPAQDTYRISVTDRGPGVPLQLRDDIFEWYTSQRPGNTGTGLGLPQAREVVEAHGGVLKYEDGLDGGARFWFTVPKSLQAVGGDQTTGGQRQ